MIVSESLTLCVGARILVEYRQVLSRPKFAFDPDGVEALMDFIEAEAMPVMANPLAQRLPDPDDEPFLEVAIAGRVEALVSGNLVHSPTRARAGVTVLGPTDFIAFVRRRSGP